MDAFQDALIFMFVFIIIVMLYECEVRDKKIKTLENENNDLRHKLDRWIEYWDEINKEVDRLNEEQEKTKND